MGFASTVSPERRAGLRRLRAAFDAAFDAMGGDADPSTPAYREADARYRAWIRALDAVALALLDDIDAFEALAALEALEAVERQDRPRAMDVPCAPPRAAAAAGEPVEPVDIDRLFSGLDELRRSVDLIGPPLRPAAPQAGAARAQVRRHAAARARAMSVVGHDRAARQWRLSLGVDGPDGAAPNAGAATPP